MRLAVDVMGGDHGPEELLQGVKLGLAAEPGIQRCFVVGREGDLVPLRSKLGLHDPRLEFRFASEVITMEDDPALGVRRKKDSSVLRAVELVRDGLADVVISSGNTGGLLAGATFRLGRLEGVKRPALACIMPNRRGAWVLLDGGANPACTPEMLVQFAVMGSTYAGAMLELENPRVGILANGSEESKGTELTRDALALLRRTALNCRGYCEGYELFLDGIDVCVCDGFVGNIVLKTSESLGKTIGFMLKEELSANPLRLLGALLAKTGLDRIKQRMNPEAYGGAPLLGLNGYVIKVHGGAKRTAVRWAMQQAHRVAQLRLNDTLVKAIAAANRATSAGVTTATATSDGKPSANDNDRALV